MQLRRGWFVLTIFVSGCATAPLLIGVAGSDQVPLGTREQVHDAFGTPTTTGTIDGTRFEEFTTEDGCGAIVGGFRVSLYQPFSEFPVDWDDLQLTLLDYANLPAKGKNLVVVASVNNVLHFRLFDRDGKMAVDTDEIQMAERLGPLADLKQLLANLWPQHELTEEESCQILAAVAAIVGRVPPGSFELGLATVKRCGLVRAVIIPTAQCDPGRLWVHPGQKLRFDFDDAGNVTKVYVDGKYLMSPNRELGKLPKHGMIFVGCGE